MAQRKPPDNDHDTLMALWCAVIGTNGEGIAERVKRLENRGRNSWLIAKDVALLIIAVSSTFICFIQMIWLSEIKDRKYWEDFMVDIKKDFLTPNKWSRPGIKLRTINGLVLHWTADPHASALNIKNFFEGRKLGEGGYGSAHYVVGLDGEVLQMIPGNEMAYHVGSKSYTEYSHTKFGPYPNNCTIGIEMCVVDAEGSYEEETWNSSILLCAYLCKKFGLDPYRDITTHQAIVGWKICPKWFHDHPEDLELFKYQVLAAMDTAA